MINQFNDYEMKKTPKGLKLVVFFFFIMASIMLVCVFMGMVSRLLHLGIDSFLSNKILVFSTIIAMALLLCAMRLHTGQRWIWIISLALNVMLLGSLFFIPLIVFNFIILLKQDTRQFFSVRSNNSLSETNAKPENQE